MRVLGVLSAFWCLRVMNVPTLQCIVPNRPWARRSTRDPPCQGHGTVAWQSGFCISHSLRETTPTENKSTAFDGLALLQHCLLGFVLMSLAIEAIETLIL